MIAVPLASPPTADVVQSIADPVERRGAARCETSLVRKAGGELSTIDVTAFRRAGHLTVLRGTIRVLQKPATRPGEMTPTHVIVLRYSYECRLDRRLPPRIKLNSLGD